MVHIKTDLLSSRMDVTEPHSAFLPQPITVFPQTSLSVSRKETARRRRNGDVVIKQLNTSQLFFIKG
jgi:hypothetical protein